MPRGRFSPARYHRYLTSIDEQIAPFERSGFYLSDDLRYVTEVDGVRIVGTIECEGGIRLEVEERLRFLRRSRLFTRPAADWVELEFYRYNAVLSTRGSIFRYNSPHQHHREFHHVHRFDVLGTGAETVAPVEERDVPTLRQVLQEAEDWYWAHRPPPSGP